MDWLNDKKNQPIVIGVLVLALAIAGVVIYMTQFAGGGSPDATVADTTTSTPASTDPTGAGSTTVTPASTTTASSPAPSGESPMASAPGGGTQVAAAGPMESSRVDPFKPIGYKPAKAAPKLVPYVDIPIPQLPRYRPNRPTVQLDTNVPQPTRRMAGLLLNGRVYAIIESNGTTQVVQPGDTLNDRLAVVDRIERDKVILKTTSDRVPRYLTVRMSAAPRQDQSTGGATSPTAGPNRQPSRGPMGRTMMP